MSRYLDEAIRMLDDGDCTLAVVNGDSKLKLHRRGVADLVSLLSDCPALLYGASVADKIIGKAAAALMIEGGVTEVYTRVVTCDALQMFEAAGIPVSYGETVPMVINRTGTGRCPIDTICAPLSDRRQMIAAIRQFLEKINNHTS